MGTEHVLAIDLGTGGPKAALVDTDGRITAHEFEPTPLELLGDGGAEQDPDAWWAAITAAVHRLVGGGHVEVADIVAVSVTSQWSGTVAVDADGKHLGVVTSGTFSPTLQRPIAMAYVQGAEAGPGNELAVDLRTAFERVKIVPLPFYKRPKKS